jgi:hypothetical protein
MTFQKLIPHMTLCLIASLGVAWAQADINENLETAFVYVDGTLGSDSNPGTQAKPFKSIGKAATVAVANNQHGIGTRVTINPGIYPETISLSNNGTLTSLPITFQAAAKGTVKISGSDVWTGWQPYSGNSNIYTHAWPYAWGLCARASSGPLEQDINLRREMIFVNGVMLTQVMTQSQLGRGTFFVDESHAIVYIYPALGTDVSTANVEVATRPALFSAYKMTNLVLRGLRFEQGNDCRDHDTVAFNGGNNILIESDGFNWNNAGGFAVNAVTSFTVRSSVARHNGERGFKSYQSKNGVWNALEADYNAWRGAQGGIYGWSEGGFYFYAQHDNTVANLKMFYNMTHGLHWDTDQQNVWSKSIIGAYNLHYGLVVEKSEGPLNISNSTLCYNGLLGMYYDGGMLLRASTFVNMTGNTFAYNAVSQIPVIGIMGGVFMPVTNYETGEQYSLVTQNLTMKSNTVIGAAGQQLFYDFDQSGLAWTDFQETLVSDKNTWWSDSVAQPFTVPIPAYYTTIDWPHWLSLTGQDTHSTFAAPAGDPTIPCQVQPDFPDFWFVNPNTGALTVNAGSPAVFTMLLIPLGAFNGQTFFSSYGVSLIPGASLNWSQPSLTRSGTVTFTVSTRSATPKGIYPVTMTARSGDVTRNITVWLTVQ